MATLRIFIPHHPDPMIASLYFPGLFPVMICGNKPGVVASAIEAPDFLTKSLLFIDPN